MTTPQDVLEFWCGTLRDDGTSPPEAAARWWKKDPGFDRTIAERFGDTLERAAEGALTWGDGRDATVAQVIVLDQFSRNVYRDTPRAFAADPRALSLAKTLVDSDAYLHLPAAHAYFTFMPFMHSEELTDQARAVALFTKLAEMATSDAVRSLFANGADFAEKHRVIVARFGRFPHRNALLGRETTAEEAEFLKQPGSSF